MTLFKLPFLKLTSKDIVFSGNKVPQHLFPDNQGVTSFNFPTYCLPLFSQPAGNPLIKSIPCFNSAHKRIEWKGYFLLSTSNLMPNEVIWKDDFSLCFYMLRFYIWIYCLPILCHQKEKKERKKPLKTCWLYPECLSFNKKSSNIISSKIIYIISARP